MEQLTPKFYFVLRNSCRLYVIWTLFFQLLYLLLLELIVLTLVVESAVVLYELLVVQPLSLVANLQLLRKWGQLDWHVRHRREFGSVQLVLIHYGGVHAPVVRRYIRRLAILVTPVTLSLVNGIPLNSDLRSSDELSPLRILNVLVDFIDAHFLKR